MSRPFSLNDEIKFLRDMIKTHGVGGVIDPKQHPKWENAFNIMADLDHNFITEVSGGGYIVTSKGEQLLRDYPCLIDIGKIVLTVVIAVLIFCWVAAYIIYILAPFMI